jgi:hypothetical protein
MKILKTTASFILLCTITANAQVTKGNWMVGGNANFSSSKSESTFNNDTVITKGSALAISPTLGYFIIDKLALGLGGSFVLSLPTGGSSSNGYGFGPFARYYFLKPEKTINILTQISYGYFKNSSGSDGDNFSIKAGPVVYFNSSVGLEFLVDYTVNTYNNQDVTSKTSGINVGFGLQIHLEK